MPTGKKVKIKSANGRSASSVRWLNRQLNDPFVRKARELGYRSRATFKIREIDAKFHIFKRGMKIADIGSAPGGWSEYAVQKAGAGNVAAIDILDMEPVAGVHFKRADFNDAAAKEFIMKKLAGKADVVMSDIAPNTTGNPSVDHLQIMALVEQAYLLAVEILKPGGTFVAKVRQGGTEATLLSEMKKRFASAKHFKPDSSRKESAETYLVAQNFIHSKL
ncbi:MAG: RlmE family RNA methyltransferase [Rickettsiales bacterium]|jgi:23S rRNA (uridine2552-2'-O)-methyltransferase|nr:RlmE family RNA methyltransferase [Rickettsiales bacterium]